MKLSTSMSLAGLAAVSAASPAPRFAPDLTPFFLKVTSPNQAVNSKCVVSYHTGAGLSDAVLLDCGPAPAKLFTFGANIINFNGYGNGITSAVRANDGGVSYDSWGEVVINAGDPGSEFTYSTQNGFVQKNNGFGFIACQWSHDNNYQLFALGAENRELPSNCAPVVLLQGCYNTDPGCNN